ncbi:MAG: hypothetical protein COT91_03185 [Candidatus Doudnabacteria bacterium CG10_big_fil_rev_8_21_14_0_10_41_10]|uniref:Insulinase family protein n=1 Tax=Candidatus Doudnabacteria bacterium CG10_big_fil_rev_8_21_14_0_10_41_10 TaxID=1974551 RepID=A0A2H0VDA5_9BACT|nr:MAG: hypothetical protein COT91_03185 [Candidatus Doudnabacteria bacterium CG10_big_fil_rev_8_21_14_0_10_41_10]
MKYTKQVLKNGITVLKVPMKDSESVLVNFFVKTGSRNEPKKLRGMSHFLEHLLFKGTKKYPNAKILSSTVEAIGADYNAATSKEYTLYYIKAAAKYLPLIFDVLSDMLQNPKLDPKEIEREKGVIVEEMNMYRDTPMRHIGNVLEEHMWPNSDLGAEIIGDEKTVARTKREHLMRYIASNYKNKNLTLSIAGKYDDKKLNDLLKKYWSKGNLGKAPKYSSAPTLKKGPKVKIVEKKTQQAHLALGFYGFDYNNKDNYILKVLSNILGGGMSSRLFTEIRERRGLAYYVRMGEEHFQDTGSVVITAGLRLEKLEEAIKVISEELRKIKNTKVSPEELKKAKENMKGRMTLSLEDTESRMEWYLGQIAFQKKIMTPKESFAKVDKVTATQLQKLARKLFKKNNYKLAVIGPYKGKEKKLEKLIEL